MRHLITHFKHSDKRKMNFIQSFKLSFLIFLEIISLVPDLTWLFSNTYLIGINLGGLKSFWRLQS